MSRPSIDELLQLFERSPIGMYRSYEDGRLQYVNPALVRMLGYDSVEQLLTKNVNTDLYADHAERKALIAKHRPMGMVDGALVHWKARDGRPLLIRLFGHVIESDGDTPASFDASVIDVTELGARTAELRQQQAEIERTATTLDLVVQQVRAIWWLTDRDLRLLRTGGPIMEILGYDPNTYIGRTVYDAIADEPDSPENPSISSHKRALEGETVRHTSHYRGREFESTLAPYRIGGEVVGVIGTIQDVTASRALERRMVDAQRAESLGVLAGGLAHDFNNLLVAILGNADLGLRDVRPGAPGYASLENIRNASLRAAELTDQLLAYAGRGRVSSARVSPSPLVAELLRITATRMPPNIAVRLDIPADLALRGDAAQVRQVMMNLVVNACDAIGDRGGTITIAARSIHLDGSADPDDALTASAGTYILLEVIDDGPGIDRDVRRHIFDPFFTTKTSGHGLGLAAVLGIVRAHAGGLRVRSMHGSGATFQVLWPAATTPSEQPATNAPSRTVLVIDDEDLVRDVVVRMIEDLGYAALAAADGPTGLELVERTKVDAVLVDLTMPRMSGADVVVALRERHPSIPIVLCTGYDRDRRGPVTADAYLPKPFRLEALEQTLAKLLA